MQIKWCWMDAVDFDVITLLFLTFVCRRYRKVSSNSKFCFVLFISLLFYTQFVSWIIFRDVYSRNVWVSRYDIFVVPPSPVYASVRSWRKGTPDGAERRRLENTFSKTEACACPPPLWLAHRVGGGGGLFKKKKKEVRKTVWKSNCCSVWPKRLTRSKGRRRQSLSLHTERHVLPVSSKSTCEQRKNRVNAFLLVCERRSFLNCNLSRDGSLSWSVRRLCSFIMHFFLCQYPWRSAVTLPLVSPLNRNFIDHQENLLFFLF